jgi:hypothetical protein
MQQQYAQQLAKSNLQGQQQQQLLQLQKQQHQQQGMSTLPQLAPQGVLPQISGVGSLLAQHATSKYAAEVGIPQVPKRRRKPRINYPQDRTSRRNGQNAEQVMKAYGIPKSLVPK